MKDYTNNRPSFWHLSPFIFPLNGSDYGPPLFKEPLTLDIYGIPFRSSEANFDWSSPDPSHVLHLNQRPLLVSFLRETDKAKAFALATAVQNNCQEKNTNAL